MKEKFKSCISLEHVEGHHHGNAEQVGDFNLLLEVAQATTFNQAQVLQQEEKKSQQPQDFTLLKVAVFDWDFISCCVQVFASLIRKFEQTRTQPTELELQIVHAHQV